MSDNEDLLGDDLGDHILADYNLGNDEEDQLLADDFENGSSQNVPTSAVTGFVENELTSTTYPTEVNYNSEQPSNYQPTAEPECVVPNITVEIPNTPLPEHSTYAPYNEAYENEHAVPAAIPAASVESPQIVPSEVITTVPNGDTSGSRERFMSERPPGAQRTPQVRDIPDTLDKVYVPRGSGFIPRGRNSWRNPQFAARHQHPYRRNNAHWGNFQRHSFPPPQIRPHGAQMRPDIRHDMRPQLHHQMTSTQHQMRPEIHHPIRPELQPDIRPKIHHDLHLNHEMRPDMRLEIRPELRHELRPELRNDMRTELQHELRPEPPMRVVRPPQMGPEISPERPILPQETLPFRPMENRPPFAPSYPRFPNQFRPEDPRAPNLQPNFEPRPMYQYQRPPYNPRPFPPPPMREIVPSNINHIPQVTIRQNLPPRLPMPNVDPPRLPIPNAKVGEFTPKVGEFAHKIEEFGPKPGGREPEVRMLPVQFPTIPPAGLTGKKVLINPHFKGNFQPTEGPVKDLDDAAERFIAEQRNALARAASRKFAHRSPQRYIENTTIEIENELAHGSRRSEDELLRKQEEFINANRAGLRRRMRSPSPPPIRRSPSPRRSPERRRYSPPDEESEYRRRLREQESLRERVIRAKEVRRRKNAVALQKQIQEREREYLDKENPTKKESPISEPKPSVPVREREIDMKPTSSEAEKPDTTKKSPERTEKVEKVDKVSQPTKFERLKVEKERSPVKVKVESAEANSTCENLTPPRPIKREKEESLERDLTPPLPDPLKVKVDDKKPERQLDTDDELDLILDDIDDILSEDEDTGRFKDRSKKMETPKPKPPVDLRSKLPPKPADTKKPPRQKIVFEEHKETKKRKDKSPPPKKASVTSSKSEDTENTEKRAPKNKQKDDISSTKRPRITFDNKQPEKEKDQEKSKQPFSNRRVVLQRNVNTITKESKSVFSRIEIKTDPSKPNPGIFSRAVRTAIGTEKTRIIVKKEPEVEYESDSDIDEDKLLEDVDLGNIAVVSNLPHGMTDTRLKTLAGSDVQSLLLDKEERSAKITFKTLTAAESFKKKFNNKMVAASRLCVILQ